MNARVEIARGWDLFRLGALAEAESLFSPLTDDPQAMRLLLWVALRRGDAEAKRRYGAGLAGAGDPNLSAVGRAHQNVAMVTLSLDPEPWLVPKSKWAQAEVAYARALVAFIRGDASSIRTELSGALPQNAEQRVRYAQLRAWAKALGEDFEAQAHLLLHALTIGLREDVDRTLVSRIAQSLSHLVREMDLGEVAAHADMLLESVQWPADATTYQFYALRAIAWRKATCGEWIAALRILNQTLTIAPDDMRRGLVHADRARIRDVIAEHSAAESSRSAAMECFARIDWNVARNDEAIGVLSSIDALACEPEAAHRLFESAAAATVSKMSGGGHGRRHEAFRRFALSWLNDGEAGLAHSQEAYSLFKRMKYIHRGIDCAVRAVDLGGGARWRQRVERLASEYPNSLATYRYQRANSPLQRINGRRREVLELLATTDKTKREIGESLGVTETTVRDHVRRIYQTLGIESRSQLLRMYLTREAALSGGSRVVIP